MATQLQLDSASFNLKGKTPVRRYFEMNEATPFSDAFINKYEPSSERIQDANYKRDLEIVKLKRPL